MLTFRFSGADGVMVCEEVITSGMVGRQVKLEFSPEWESLRKTAVFRAGEISRIVDQVEDLTQIPWEVLSVPLHRLSVGVWGTDDAGKLVIPTVMAVGPMIRPGADPEQDPATDPENPFFLQLREEMEQMHEKIDQLQEDVDALKYHPIEILEISNNPGMVEIGTVVEDVTVRWELSKTPVRQSINGQEVAPDAREFTFTGQEITVYKSFTLVVTDEREHTAENKTGVTFVNGLYYGVKNGAAPSDDQELLDLQRQLQIGKKFTFTVDAGIGQRIVFALPDRHGTPSFRVNGFAGGFSLAQSFLFTNSAGFRELYHVWVSDNAGLGQTTVEVT